jgi:hypothetical protein
VAVDVDLHQHRPGGLRGLQGLGPGQVPGGDRHALQRLGPKLGEQPLHRRVGERVAQDRVHAPAQHLEGRAGGEGERAVGLDEQQALVEVLEQHCG